MIKGAKSDIASIFVLVAIAGFWPTTVPAQDVRPSLAETLGWMDSTFNPHTATGGSFGYGIEEDYSKGKLVKRKIETFSYVGCTITLHVKDDPTTPISSDMYQSIRYTFNLRDIDPSSIMVQELDSQYDGMPCGQFPSAGGKCDMAHLIFETQDKERLIEEDVHTTFPKLKGKDHESRGKNNTFVATFLLGDVQYASHFEAAFHHAIVLCGGKPSPF